MKKISQLVLLSCCIFITVSGYSRKLYAFGFFSTNDQLNGETTRKAVKNNYDDFRWQVEDISYRLNIELVPSYFVGSEYNKDNAEALLSRYEFNPDDIVFMYFTGHGYHLAGQPSAFPSVYLNNLEYGNDTLFLARNSLSFEAYCMEFIRKRPGLFIGVVDACNANANARYIPDAWGDYSFLFTPGRISSSVIIDRYTDLFLKVKGTILISSTSVNESAEVSNNGTTFTSNLFYTLDLYAAENTPVTWEQMLKKVQNKTSDYTRKISNRSQTPFWQASLNPASFIPEVSANKLPLIKDEFRELIEEGKQEMREKKYNAALKIFNKAFELKQYNRRAKFFVFQAQAFMEDGVFSSIDIDKLCELKDTDAAFRKCLTGPGMGCYQFLVGMYSWKRKRPCGSDLKKKEWFNQTIQWLQLSSDNGFEAAAERLKSLQYHKINED